MYGFRGNGMYGLGDTCSDLATQWVQDMQACQAAELAYASSGNAVPGLSPVSMTNPSCLAQNQAFQQGGANNCSPELFVATQVALANPTATVQQVAQVVQQQVPVSTAQSAAAAAAAVVNPNPVATPIVTIGAPIISVASSGAVSSAPAPAGYTPTGTPGVMTSAGNVVPLAATPTAADQLAAAMAPAGAGSNFCLFGDSSAPVGGLPVCAYTLYGGLALLALLLVMKK